MKQEMFTSYHNDVIKYLPINCRFWVVIDIKNLYEQRFVKVSSYNTSRHQIHDYFKPIRPVNLVK